MCGIIGYIGKNGDIKVGLEALKRLEYRGYDSSGTAFYDSKMKKITTIKAVGKIAKLEEKLNKTNPQGVPFIFHTRWATHGAPTLKNAHPHTDDAQNFYVVHNGIIENYQELREFLKNQGYKLITQTDSEVLPHLIRYYFRGNLLNAVQKALDKVIGTYGIAVISSQAPNELVIARLGSPLLIGVGKDGYFVSSDPAGILEHTKKVIYLQEGEIVKLTPDSIQLFNQKKIAKRPKVEEIEWELEEAQKGGYPHFMLKEIMEQSNSIKETMRGRLLPKEGNVKLGGLELVKDKLIKVKKLYIKIGRASCRERV